MSVAMLQGILATVDAGMRFPTSPPLRQYLYAIAASYALDFVLYVAATTKRLSDGWANWWWARKDSEGYLKPNVYLIVPIFAAIHTAVYFAGVFILIKAMGDYDRPIVLACSIGAAGAAHCFSWTRTWAMLYSVPAPGGGIVRSMQASSRGYSGRLSPRTFNLLMHLGFIIPALVILPGPLFVVIKSTDSFNQFLRLKAMIGDYVSTAATNPIEAEVMVPPIMSVLKGMQIEGQRIQTLSKVQAWLFGGVVLLDIIAYDWPSIMIIRALTRQVKALEAVGRPFRKPTLTSDRKRSTSFSASEHSSRSSGSISFWKLLVPSVKIGNPSAALWEEPGDRTQIVHGNKEVAKQRRRQLRLLKRYRMNVIYQVILIGLGQASYLTLNILLIANAWDAPTRTPYPEVQMIVYVWIGATFAWTLGPLLGIITCIMVWMPMPTMPREPQTYVASSDEGEQAGVELPYRSRSATQPVADSAFCPVLLERRSVNLQRDHSYSASSGADAKTADFSSRSGEFSMREKTPLPHGYEDEDTEVERVEEDARTERTSGDRRSFVTAETTQNAAPARTQELPGDRGIPLSHVDVIRAARMQRR